MADGGVWVQLYVGKGKSGEVFDLEPVPKNISALKKAVKAELLNDLAHCDAAQLVVYKYSPDTEDSPKEQDKLWPDIAVPNDTSARTPLRVVAPAIENQQGKNFMVLSFLLDYANDQSSCWETKGQGSAGLRVYLLLLGWICPAELVSEIGQRSLKKNWSIVYSLLLTACIGWSHPPPLGRQQSAKS